MWYGKKPLGFKRLIKYRHKYYTTNKSPFVFWVAAKFLGHMADVTGNMAVAATSYNQSSVTAAKKKKVPTERLMVM